MSAGALAPPQASLRPAATAAADWRALAWLLLAALLVLGAGLGLRDPWPSDEPRFALVARTMVETGDWWFPRRGSELYHDKPPMLMWLQALAWQLTGHWRVAFLLPSLLAGLVTLTLVWDLGRRLWSARAGLFAAGAVLAAVMFSFQFKRAQIDPLVTMWITLANWGLLIHLLRGPHWGAFWLGCFAAGLGVITKGVGVIALLMLVPYVLARRAGWPGLTRTQGAGWRWAAGGAAFLGAIALWLLPVVVLALARGTPEHLEYLHDILFEQTARRYAGEVGGHERPWWYFVPVVLLHFFPLSLVYGAAWRDWRAGWHARDARLVLLVGWCLLVFLFFTGAGGKREVYLLPMLPMLALALAPTLQRVAGARWLRWAALGCAVGLGLALVAVGAMMAGYGPSGRSARVVQEMAERGLSDTLPTLGGWLVAAGALALAAAALGRTRRGLHALLVGLATWWLVWGLVLAPAANSAVSAADVMRQADAVAGPTGEIALVAWKEQNMLMAPRPVHDFGFSQPPARQFERAAAWLHEAPDTRWLLALGPAVAACVDPDRVTVVGHANRRAWWMFQADALRAACRLPDHPSDADADDGA